jgi:hypothetical protein
MFEFAATCPYPTGHRAKLTCRRTHVSNRLATSAEIMRHMEFRAAVSAVRSIVLERRYRDVAPARRHYPRTVYGSLIADRFVAPLLVQRSICASYFPPVHCCSNFATREARWSQ